MCNKILISLLNNLKVFEILNVCSVLNVTFVTQVHSGKVVTRIPFIVHYITELTLKTNKFLYF